MVARTFVNSAGGTSKVEVDIFAGESHAFCMKPNSYPTRKLPKFARWGLLLFLLLGGSVGVMEAQTTNGTPLLEIKADEPMAQSSPTLYGLMTEEINYSYDGGLYAELIRNRSFKENTTNAVHWQLVTDRDAAGTMSLDDTEPLNETMTRSLKLEVTRASREQPVGIANDGFWGISVKPKTRYHASFYARAGGRFNGPLRVALVSSDNKTVYASAAVRRITEHWQKYEVTLTTGKVEASKDNRLVISAASPGTIWFGMVSLFPPTWNNRPNGNRPDIMQLLADMKPKFLRFPGGNYVEGQVVSNRFDWEKTVGDVAHRPGHFDDAWGYWSSDGMGLLEFLEWCEDLEMQPVLAIYAGYSMKQGGINPGTELEPYVQSALNEIEYVTGDAHTKWGAQRIKDGHRAAFKLEYIEIGNEDNLGTAGRTYGERFAQFYDAIKAKYPQLKIISTAPSYTRLVTARKPDVIDDHYYRSSMQFQSDAAHYDKGDRNGSKIFVGEWATREGVPTPNMSGALGDAAWMTGMERNSDLIVMASYAPLFVNVNPGGMQWRTDLIGYDALTSYGSPSYYAQKMFSTYRGDGILAVSAQDVPSREWRPPPRRGGNGQPGEPRQVPSLFFDATRDSKSGRIYLKVVNCAGEAQPVQVTVSGLGKVAAKGEMVELSAASPDDTNSIKEPAKIVPVMKPVDDLGVKFTRTFPPYSITVLVMKGK